MDPKIGRSNQGMPPSYEPNKPEKADKKITPQQLQEIFTKSQNESIGIVDKLKIKYIGMVKENLEKKLESMPKGNKYPQTVDDYKRGLVETKLELAKVKYNQYSKNTHLDEPSFKQKVSHLKKEIEGFKDQIKWMIKDIKTGG
jgi:hypothetical protein